MENNYSLDKSSLVNILTLRYDPEIKPNLIPKTPQDFSEDKNFINIPLISYFYKYTEFPDYNHCIL